MKNLINVLFTTLLSGLAFIACDDGVETLTSPLAPTDLTVVIDTTDSTGLVSFTPSGNNVLFFEVRTGDGNIISAASGETVVHQYNGAGNLSFDALIVGFSTGGLSSTVNEEINIFIDLVNDPVLVNFLAGGLTNSNRRWIWNQTVGGHFGVGSPDTDFPGFFAAMPNQLADCLYDDVLEFSTDAEGNLLYNLITQGVTFVNGGQLGVLFPGEGGGDDQCREADDLLQLETSAVAFLDLNNDNSPSLILGGGSFSPLSYFANVPQWEIDITSLTEDGILSVRGLNQAARDGASPDDGGLAWYHQFIPEDGIAGGRIFDTDNLIFSDEFEGTELDLEVWNFDIGTGSGTAAGAGWGNQEAQFYTDRPENIVVEDGLLKITALRENFGSDSDNRDFTSARINSQDKFEFTEGRVDFRARVPAQAGTWVATWLLGADVDTNPWPAAGELDVMEHVGNQVNRIFGTTHSPAGFGGTAIGSSTIISDATSEFRVYSMDWTSDQVIFYVDDVEYFRYAPATINEETFPFDNDFFLLINFAMGGTFGGDIDAAFMEETFEVDYVRVYQ
ncbi:MAG: glycoside hydrolase family 16 protein [Bacteroidota bacterium]